MSKCANRVPVLLVHTLCRSHLPHMILPVKRSIVIVMLAVYALNH